MMGKPHLGSLMMSILYSNTFAIGHHQNRSQRWLESEDGKHDYSKIKSVLEQYCFSLSPVLVGEILKPAERKLSDGVERCSGIEGLQDSPSPGLEHSFGSEITGAMKGKRQGIISYMYDLYNILHVLFYL